ncbi:MAG: ketopantoate reductase family protein [Sterolibacteriaceae bacterium]|nr:ketopantoate reductase family protein [Candidatus Methylophosphatis haderslevensis]
MKILVLGAGATGGYFGGRLAEAAQLGKASVDVSFLVRPARAERLAAEGLRVDSPHGGFALPVRTVVQAALRPDYDLVLLTCKAYDLDSAIESIAPALRADTLILPVLNGLAHFERLDREFGAARVLGGCCHIAGVLTREGVVRQLTDVHRITYGLRPGNAAAGQAVLDRLHGAFGQTPVDARLVDDIDQEIWEKFVFLATLAGMTTLMRGSVGDIVAAPGGAALAERMLAECESAAAAAGKPSRPKVAASTLKTLTQPGSPLTASMLRDLESGGRIESAHIVGDMLARVRAAGHDASLLDAAWVHLQVRDLRRAREVRG